MLHVVLLSPLGIQCSKAVDLPNKRIFIARFMRDLPTLASASILSPANHSRFPSLMTIAPYNRFVGHVRGLKHDFTVERKPEILCIIMGFEGLHDFVDCLLHFYFMVGHAHIKI